MRESKRKRNFKRNKERPFIRKSIRQNRTRGVIIILRTSAYLLLSYLFLYKRGGARKAVHHFEGKFKDTILFNKNEWSFKKSRTTLQLFSNILFCMILLLYNGRR